MTNGTFKDAKTVEVRGPMSEAEMIITFNEWMRRYTEEPEKFQREFQTVSEFLKEQADGKEPSYGAACTAYQYKLRDELNA